MENGGKQWEPVSSQIVNAKLRMKEGKHLAIVSVYAPMFLSPQQDKDFYADLQRVIDQVLEEDILVVMGDWNGI